MFDLSDLAWVEELTKAKRASAKQIEQFKALLARFDRRIETVFLDAIERLGNKINVEEIGRLLALNQVQAALTLVSEQLITTTLKPVGNEVSYSMMYAARETAAAIAAQANVRDAAFDSTTQDVVAELRNREERLIRGIAMQSLGSARVSILEGFRTNRDPYDIARDVKRNIGLTQRQTQAVLNYRKSLQNRERDALQRQLRDRRFDGTVRRAIKGEKPLTREQIDAMTERYRQRWRAHRAKTIAQNESIKAVNGGSWLAWQQLVREGVIPEEAVRRKWVYIHDSRVRDSHRAIPSMNPEGVGMNEKFITPDGPLLYPGDPSAPPEATINCRCSVAYEIDEVKMKEKLPS
jgi:hypothetical protein